MPRPASLQDHCRALRAATEDVKWGAALCFSVGGKLFVMFDLDDQREFSFKCDEDDYDRLTEIPGIIPAPYAARYGWVKATTAAKLPVRETRSLLTKAHSLAAQKLSKKKQRELGIQPVTDQPPRG